MRLAPRRRLLGATLLLFTSGCQLLFGDFSLGEPAAAPPSVLGLICEPNTFRCSGERLETCAPDRNSWSLVESCAGADQCDATAAACHPCTPDQWMCNGAELARCDATQHWQAEATCDSPELCSVSASRTAGGCADAACAYPGAHECDENRLLLCAPGLDRMLLADRCGSAALCDAAKADAQAAESGWGNCVAPTCLAGTFACDGATLTRCNADLTGFEFVQTCADAASCNPGSGTCIPGVAGEAACSGSELYRAGAAGFTKAETCGAPELCSAVVGACENRECTSGAVRCVTGDLSALEECGNDGRWVVREACGSPALCHLAEGRCLAPACADGETRCLGQTHQVCSGDLTRFVDNDQCGAGETCESAGCLAAGCAEGTARCNGVSLERCVAGQWLGEARCATAALCNEALGVCEEPTCGGLLEDFFCQSTSLKQCASGRDGWEDFRPCPGGCSVDRGIPTCN